MDATPKSTRNTPKSATPKNRSQLLSIVGATPKRKRPEKPIDLPLERKTFKKDGFRVWLKYMKEKWERQRVGKSQILNLKFSFFSSSKSFGSKTD